MEWTANYRCWVTECLWNILIHLHLDFSVLFSGLLLVFQFVWRLGLSFCLLWMGISHGSFLLSEHLLLVEHGAVRVVSLLCFWGLFFVSLVWVDSLFYGDQVVLLDWAFLWVFSAFLEWVVL